MNSPAALAILCPWAIIVPPFEITCYPRLQTNAAPRATVDILFLTTIIAGVAIVVNVLWMLAETLNSPKLISPLGSMLFTGSQ